jgi:hypothetical protein
MAGMYRMVPFELVEGADGLREGKEQFSSELPDVTLSATRLGYLLVWIEADLECIKVDGVSWH